MELYESYENLNRINFDILKAMDEHYRLNDDTKDYSPSSKVEVLTLKDKLPNGQSKHSWDYVLENIVEDENVAFIVLRSNFVQLMAVQKGDENEWYITCPRYVYHELNKASQLGRVDIKIGSRRIVEFDRLDPSYRGSTINQINIVKQRMMTVVFNFIAYNKFIKKNENTKMNWDIIVVYKDNTMASKSFNRFENEDRVYLPHEPEYEPYIERLQRNLLTRLETYSNNKLDVITTEDELKTSLGKLSTLFPKKIKIVNTLFTYDTYYEMKQSNNLSIEAHYVNRENQIKMVIIYISQGMQITVKKITFEKNGLMLTLPQIVQILSSNA